MKTNPSREQLSKSFDRRTKHLMIRTLEKFEDTFPDLDETREGRIFKGDIRNAFNDVMRAQRDEIRDYDVDYRPLKMTDDNTLAMTQTFMQAVQGVNFGFSEETTLSLRVRPFFEIYAATNKRHILESLRTEFGTGAVSNINRTDTGEGLMLQIVGTQSCVDCVLPIMDRYRLHGVVEPKYAEWRDQVVKIYRS